MLTYYSVIYGFVVIWNSSIRLSKFTVSSIAVCSHYWAINPVKEYAVMTLSKCLKMGAAIGAFMLIGPVSYTHLTLPTSDLV